METGKNTTYIIGNWKMNTTLSEAKTLARGAFETARALQKKGLAGERELVVVPPFPFLSAVAEVVKQQVAVGAQDVSSEESGAFTGEVSAGMLASVGVSYVLVGHSERRAHHGEDDGLINRKLWRVMGQKSLKAVLCVGETDGDRSNQKTEAVLRRQVELGLEGMGEAVLAGRVLVAYEPVWAIGTGRTPEPGEVDETHRFVRSVLGEFFGAGAGATKILYGGSVGPTNAGAFLSQPHVDGVLVGGASLEAKNFNRIACFQKSG